MINVQLLSAVLGVEVISFELKQKNKIAYEYNKPSKNEWSGKDFCNRSINLYELANKCKEWAFKQGYGICSISSFGNGSSYAHIEQITDYGLLVTSESKAILGKTEPEAIFKACEYILNIGNKND